MTEYRRTEGSAVIRTRDGMCFPADPENRGYAEFLEWLSVGNEPDPPQPVAPVVPSSASRLGLMRAFKEQGAWDQIKAEIAADPEAHEEWDVAIEIRRTDPLAQKMITALGFSEAQFDALLIRAAALVA